MKTSLNKALKETKVLIHAVFATPLLYFKQTDIKINRGFYKSNNESSVLKKRANDTLLRKLEENTVNRCFLFLSYKK